MGRGQIQGHAVEEDAAVAGVDGAARRRRKSDVAAGRASLHVVEDAAVVGFEGGRGRGRSSFRFRLSRFCCRRDLGRSRWLHGTRGLWRDSSVTSGTGCSGSMAPARWSESVHAVEEDESEAGPLPGFGASACPTRDPTAPSPGVDEFHNGVLSSHPPRSTGRDRPLMRRRGRCLSVKAGGIL